MSTTRREHSRVTSHRDAAAPAPGPIRVMAVDDHPIMRKGLAALIDDEPDMTFVAEAANGAEAVEVYRAHTPDVVLMDLSMPVLGGVAAIGAIVREHPGARIVALTTYEGDVDIYRALEAGAVGYLLKDMLHADVLDVIRTVHAGRRAIPPAVAQRLAEFLPRIELTEREIEVLTLVAKGLRNAEVARVLGRSEETVKVHLKRILEKLGAADRTEAVTVALQRGFIHL